MMGQMRDQIIQESQIDYPGDTEDVYCSRCKRITRHSCIRAFLGATKWHCDKCGKALKRN